MTGGSIPILLLIAREEAVRPPDRGEVHVNAWQRDQQRNLAASVLAHGVEGLPCGAPPLSRVVVVAGAAGPTLDDMLAATFASLLIGGRALPPGAESFAKYTELARQGIHPGKVPLEESLEGVFLAVRHNAGEALDDPAAAERFLSGWDRMARVIVEAAAGGVDPFTTPLFTEAGGFATELAFLQRDRDVYRQDLANGQRLRVHLPGGPAEAPGLILSQPRSVLFKEWARRDPESPSGGGYVFLAVQWGEDEWVFSTDPVHRIPIKGLAERLQAAEGASSPAEGEKDAWFDGAPFGHTLVSSPKRGSLLSKAKVLQIMKAWAHARPVTNNRRWPRLALAAGGVAAALVLAVLIHLVFPPTKPDVVYRGQVLGPEQVQKIRVEGPNAPSHALIVAVSKPQLGDYPALPGTLTTAGKLYALLRDVYKYDPKNIHVLADGDIWEENGKRVPVEDMPVRHIVIATLQRMARETNYPDNVQSNFLFFYGGHGAVEESARKVGFLVLSGYNPNDSDNTGFDMGYLSQFVQNKIHCSHQLLLLDCCHSGYVEARGAGGPNISRIYSLWKKRTHVVITAGTTEQSSLDVSQVPIFTDALLQALTPDLGNGRAPADLDGDGIITDEELHTFLKTQVSERARRVDHDLTPQIRRGLREDPAADVGQFLFVLPSAPRTAR